MHAKIWECSYRMAASTRSRAGGRFVWSQSGAAEPHPPLYTGAADDPQARPPQHVTSTHMRCRRQAHGGVVGTEQDTCVQRNTGRWGWCMKASSSLTQMHASKSSNPDAESERPPFLRERIAARPASETPRPPAELLRTLPASSVPCCGRTRFGPLSVRKGRSKKHLFVQNKKKVSLECDPEA